MAFSNCVISLELFYGGGHLLIFPQFDGVILPRFGGSSATSVLWIQPLFVDKEGETHVLQFISSSKVINITYASIFSPWF